MSDSGKLRGPQGRRTPLFFSVRTRVVRMLLDTPGPQAGRNEFCGLISPPGDGQMEKRDVQATGLSRLDNALAQLDPQSRQIMELWLEGVTDSDVASQLALPERVVEVIRARAFWQVRELMLGSLRPKAAR